jgi:tetratricopeptide (TPR) repeat protein
MHFLTFLQQKGRAGTMTVSSKTIAHLLGVLAVALLLAVPAGAKNGVGFVMKQEIIDALDRHDTTQVLALIDGELKIDPAYAPYYLLRGRILFAREQYAPALKEFETALEKKPKFYEAMYYQGLVLLKLGKLDEADKVLSEGVKKAKEEKALFHNGMGLLLLQRQEYAKADLEFRKAIQVGPDQAEFHANLGDANYFAQVYPLAISEYNTVIQMDTSFLDVYFRLARAYVAQNQYNEALDQLRTVLTRDSLYSHAWNELGKLYTMAGLSAGDPAVKEQRFKEAIGSYRKYLELSKDSSKGEVFFNLGRAYFTLGGFPEAIAALERVLAIGDVPTNIYLYLGRAYMGQEDYQKGLEALQKHLSWLKEKDPDWKPGPEDAEVFRRIGDAYKAQSDWANAAENYVKAAELAPDDPRIAADAALAYHQLKNYAEALKYYQKRIDLGPEAWNMYLNAAYCTMNLEDFPKSVEYLLKVVEIDPTQEKAIVLLSNTYLYRLQDCENGVKWTQKWLEKDSANCDALKSMGYAYFGNICPPDFLKAVSYFEKAVTCAKAKGADNCATSDLLLYMAQAYQSHGAALLDKDKKPESKPFMKNAFDLYKKVLNCDPGNASAKQGYADTEFAW